MTTALVWASAMVSGSPLEWVDLSGTSLTQLTAVSPPSPPSGLAMGNYCGKFSYNNDNGVQTRAMPSRANCWLGYAWRPDTDPTGGVAQHIILDDSTLNGVSFSQNVTDGALHLSNALGTSLVAFAETPSTANSYGGLTNPWYWLILEVTNAGSGSSWTGYVYKWNNNTAVWDFIESQTVVHGTGLIVYLRIGSLSSNTAAWHLGNIAVGTGDKVVGISMVRDPLTQLITNSTSWKKADTGVDDPTTGPTNTEYPYINEAPPNDATTSRLDSTATAFQDYGGTSSATLGLTGKTILGICAGMRFRDSSFNLNTYTILWGIGAIGGNPGGPNSGVGVSGAMSHTWWCCSSVDPATSVALTTADVDSLWVEHKVTRSAFTCMMSQLYVTIAYVTPAAAWLPPVMVF